ncbi:protein-tyrosine phosphatase family protein [Microbulbifer epialgicus]|uniref:Protein-tyrosine phosphatase family protein n=1 Tax=Microbulbifer epialgicus TaxID=393907 RepID=A0ABV4P6Z4_9GAMM
MPKPLADWLEYDVRHFVSLDVNVVVSLLEVPEEYELGLSAEEEVLAKHGINFIRHGVRDRGLPEPKMSDLLIDQLYRLLVSGENIAVHCRAGIGRTGMVASCLLVKDRLSSQTAIDKVTAARGVSVPDTQEQYDFICDYELRLPS